MDADDGLRASDRTRLVGLDGVARRRPRHQGADGPPPGCLRRAVGRPHARARHARARGDVLPRDRQATRADAAGRRERALPGAPPARERVHRAVRGAPLRGDGEHDDPDRRGVHKGAEEQRLARHARRCHTAAATRASMGSSRCPHWARCARRPRRCCRCPGFSAASAGTAADSQDCSPSGADTPHRWRNAPRLSWPWRRWRVREARRSEVARYGGTTRRPATAGSRPSTPRQGRENAARHTGPPRTGSGGERAGRPGGELPVRQGAAQAVRGDRLTAPEPGAAGWSGRWPGWLSRSAVRRIWVADTSPAPIRPAAGGRKAASFDAQRLLV